MINPLTLFTILFLPNIMRQLVYLASYKKTKKFGFCVSPETINMQKKGLLPFAGIIEEVFWGVLWTICWMLGQEWLAYGWISDALLDCSIAFSYSKGRRTPKELFQGNNKSFIIREIILPYVIIGPILYLLGLDIIVYSITTLIIGVILWKKI